MKHVTITTDGSCNPNPGRGGWAAILRYGSSVREITGCAAHTTNNVMEMTAVVEGLRALKSPCVVTVRTDSKNTMAWCRPGSDKRINKLEKLAHVRGLLAEYREVSRQHQVTFEWVRGHAGDADNERCDVLAEDMCRRPF